MHHHHTANSRMLAPAGPGACYLWDDGSTGNPRTVTPLQDARYSVTVLDEQLRPAIRRYNVEVVRIQTELIAALAPGDFCGAGPVTLRVEGALPHYTYLWSTGETTPSIQVPLSGIAPAYGATVTDARQDGAGNTVACAQVLELRAPEVLAAVEQQQCELLFSRLEALGFEAREVKILEPVQAIAPRSSASATCNVTDNTDFFVEWYDETLDPSGILCSEMAEMEGVTQGFIFASDGICSEADLAAMEALINDQTLLHVYLKPCAGEEFGYLMQQGSVVQGVSASGMLKKKEDKKTYVNPILANAFLEFAKSPAGYALLAKFGKKGQVISPAHIKEIPPFKEDGEYQVRKMDLVIVPDEMNWPTSDPDNPYPSPQGANGGTSYTFANGRMIHRVGINKLLNINNPFADAFEQNSTEANKTNLIMSRMGTIFHEMVGHVLINAKDYDDDKKMNASPISKIYKDSNGKPLDGNKFEHRRMIHHKNAIEPDSIWIVKYIPIVTNIWKGKNPNISSQVIKNELLNFIE